jgi:hypothetical protein
MRGSLRCLSRLTEYGEGGRDAQREECESFEDGKGVGVDMKENRKYYIKESNRISVSISPSRALGIVARTAMSKSALGLTRAMRMHRAHICLTALEPRP